MTKYQGNIKLIASLPAALEQTVSCKSKFPFLIEMTITKG